MKDFKGTKGKWRIMEQFDSPNLIIDKESGRKWYHLSCYIFGENKLIGEVSYSSKVEEGFETVEVLGGMKANANLIAAAPELLEALQECQKFMVEAGSIEAANQYVKNMDLINKALGQ